MGATAVSKRVDATHKGECGAGQRKHQLCLCGVGSRGSSPGVLEMSKKIRRSFLSK